MTSISPPQIGQLICELPKLVMTAMEIPPDRVN